MKTNDETKQQSTKTTKGMTKQETEGMTKQKTKEGQSKRQNN